MKKFFGILAVCALVLFPGCAAQTAQPSAAGSGNKLEVCTSFYAMYDFTKKIGGDKINAVNLVPSGTEPHDWEPSSSDVIRLEKADVFIYNGAGMESWADKVLASLENKKLKAVEASQGISLIHSSDANGNNERDDPHVWLDPENAKAELKNIRDALIHADTANQSTYLQNYDKYAAEFDRLDGEYRKAAEKMQNKNLVVSHQAFGYLCGAYGLTQVPIEGLSPDSEPDPKRMTEIIEFVRKNKVKAIFFEDLVSPKVAESIAGQTGAKALRLNPLEGLTEEEQAKGEDYVSVMEQNLNTLKEALD